MNQYELLNLEFVLKQIRFKELLSKDEINGFLLRFHSEKNLQQYSIERSTIEYEIRSTINELETLLQFYFFNETSKKALDEIIVENKIQVSLDDVKNGLKAQVMSYFGMGADDEAPWMDGYMDKIMKDEKTIDETYRKMLFDRLFEYLETQFTIQDKKVSEEEFFKLQDPHATHHHH